MSTFTLYIKKCKRISDTGVQQFMLDVAQLVEFFKTIPLYHNELGSDEHQMQWYMKRLKKQASKPESLLKVLMQTNADGMISTYNSLVKQPSQQELQLLMDMKGIVKPSQQQQGGESTVSSTVVASVFRAFST